MPNEIEYTSDGKHATFNGRSYTRDERTGYYLCSKPSRDGRRKRLHVAVWEYHNGKIDDGFEVHHKTMDKSRNDIGDLELLSAEEHRAMHASNMSEETKEKLRESLIKNAVPKAAEWHRSEEGIRWHSENGKRSWENREPAEYTCSYCGKRFWTKNRYSSRSNTFCSNRCKSAFRRASGIDDETRTCEVCGGEFRANRYSTKRRCDGCRHKRHPKD